MRNDMYQRGERYASSGFSVSLGTCFLYDCLWGIALLEINS